MKSSFIQLFFGYWNSFLFLLTFKLCLILLQTSSQVAKLENTVETLRTVLTQKIQSEAQTVCLVTGYVDDLESVLFKEVLNVSIILENTIRFSGIFEVLFSFYIAKPRSIVNIWWRLVGEPKTFRPLWPITSITRTQEVVTSACRQLPVLCYLPIPLPGTTFSVSHCLDFNRTTDW